MVISRDDWLEAQYAVLGSALIEPKAVPLVIAETCEEDYSGPCLAVFKAIKAHRQRPSGSVLHKFSHAADRHHSIGSQCEALYWPVQKQQKAAIASGIW